MSYYPFLSSPAATILLWGTVENLAASSSQTRDEAEDSCINIRKGEVYRDEVFITFGGPQGHDDRMASWGRLAKSACR
jgi:hypothetical protein